MAAAGLPKRRRGVYTRGMSGIDLANLRQEIIQVMQRCGRLWETEDLHTWVSVAFNGRLSSTLGRAFLDECRIELNPELLGRLSEHFKPTLIHELAHLVVRRRYGAKVKAHGLEFRILMAAAGCDTGATVKLPPALARQVIRRRGTRPAMAARRLPRRRR